LNGVEAERIGLVSLCVEDERVQETALGIAVRLAAGSRTALAFTKRALNNWLRLAGPSFDASLALEFLGFRLGDAKAGLEAVRNRKPPSFDRG
jgi:enoyl-CoA hydratase